MKNFQNKTYVDLKDPITVERQKKAIEDVRGHIGKTYVLEAAKTGTQKVISINPFAPAEVLATFTGLSAKDVQAQIQTGVGAFETCKQKAYYTTAKLLRIGPE